MTPAEEPRGEMVAAGFLLALNFVGIVLLAGELAGSRGVLQRGMYGAVAVCLCYFGFVTLLFHLIRFALARVLALGPARPLGLGTRLRRSLVRAAAILAFGTFFLMVGAQRRGIDAAPPIIVGAFVELSGSLFLILQLRRYRRWRSLRIRRDAVRRSKRW